MRIKFLVVCVLGFGFSAVASATSQEAIERNTKMFQEYNDQYEKSELFGKDKIAQFNELRKKEISGGIITPKPLSDLTISFLDNAIDTMLRNESLEPCLFIKCRWGVELLNALVASSNYDQALVIEDFLLSKMNEAKLVPVLETPFDLETPVLDCMSKTNTPALNKYLISPYGKIKERFFERLYEMGCCMTEPPINVQDTLKKTNTYWYISNLVVGSDVIRSDFVTNEATLDDLFGVCESIMRSTSFNRFDMSNLVSAIDYLTTPLAGNLRLSEVFVSDWYIAAPDFWGQPLDGVDGSGAFSHGEFYCNLSEEGFLASKEAAIERNFARVPESGVTSSEENEEKWKRISKKLFPYRSYIPSKVVELERKMFVLYLRYNRLGYDLEKLKRDESEGEDKEEKQKKMQQKLEKVKKDFYRANSHLKCISCVKKSKYFDVSNSYGVLVKDWSWMLKRDNYEYFEESDIASVIKSRFDEFQENFIKQFKEGKKNKPQELLEFIKATEIACKVFVEYDREKFLKDLIKKMKEILKTELPEKSWREIEVFEKEVENLVKEKYRDCSRILEKNNEWIEKLALIKNKIDSESDEGRLLVENAKLIIAERWLCLKMLENLILEIDSIMAYRLRPVPDFSVMLSLLEYVATYVESSYELSKQMKVLFEKLNKASLIYIKEQVEVMLARSVNNELLKEIQKILQEEMANRNGEELESCDDLQ